MVKPITPAGTQVLVSLRISLAKLLKHIKNMFVENCLSDTRFTSKIRDRINPPITTLVDQADLAVDIGVGNVYNRQCHQNVARVLSN